jgi:hypothetical protein
MGSEAFLVSRPRDPHGGRAVKNTHNDEPDTTGIRRARRVDPVPATPETEARLERIAAVRADGASWEQTATELETAAAELEALVKAHPFLFGRIMFRADREAAREDRRIARVVFRKQISKDPTSQAARLSAQCLVNIDLTYYRHRNKKTPFYGLDPNDPKLRAGIQIAEFEASTTHEHRMAVLESSLRGRSRSGSANWGSAAIIDAAS